MIAEVIVDISGSEVDKVFDYLLGHSEAVTGSRVLVPFGGRKIEGYVIGLKESSDVPKEKLKAIESCLDEFPVISEEMLELMRYMRARYRLRIVDVLRLFIPAQMRGGKIKKLIKIFAYVNPEYRDVPTERFIKASAAAQAELYEYLLCEGEQSVTELNASFSASALRNLIARGVVLTRECEVLRSPYKAMEFADKKVELTAEQQRAFAEIVRQPDLYLLHGVTGSGKTEVYMHCIDDALAKGKTAIMLVPEISLTPQVFKNFRARFGDYVAILHSGLSAGERFDEWHRLLSGRARVAVGARSAVFAPLKNLGIIIIDEEHDSSYSSESNPRYLTGEVAQKRAEQNGCALVMGSATPSVESYYLAKQGRYKLIELKNRVNRREMPPIEIVNMCAELYGGNDGIFSARLRSELSDCVEKGNQAIVFINRRGYASFLMCRHCGYVAKCTDCDVSLVYHRDENVLKCHYCNNRYAVLDVCPECKSAGLKQGFVGTQRVVKELERMFPGVNILRMDNDTTQGKDAHLEILTQFAQKKAQILVGTQMIAKGHDFPDVTLVGIVDADMSLHFNDYKSAERTFQLITQVAGRAGRDEKTGKVVLQTYSPNHYVYRFAVNNDYRGFYEKEVNLREVTKYPPFSKIVRVLISSENEQLCSDATKKVFDEVVRISREKKENFAYLAAMRSPVKRIQNKFRMQVLMRLVGNSDAVLAGVYDAADSAANAKVSVFTEVNPNSLS